MTSPHRSVTDFEPQQKRLQRRFACEYTGCGKTYTRAEHLSRHQLNHSPRRVFVCEYPDCSLSFVRKDLLDRHQLRHEKRLSNLSENTIESHEASNNKRRLSMTSTNNPLQGSVPLALESTILTPGNDQQEDQSHPKTVAPQVFANSSIDISPSSTEDFTSWLLDAQGPASMLRVMPDGSLGIGQDYSSFGQQLPGINEPSSGLFDGTQLDPTSIHIPSWPGSSYLPSRKTRPWYIELSQANRRLLLDYIAQRFSDGGHPQAVYIEQLRREIMSGEAETHDHILSLPSMHKYLESYWGNFADQLPILHQPTFVPDITPDLLLLAVMMMGASMLPKKNTTLSRFTNFIAWNLRWQALMHPDSHPPAALWVIQTLLLLETYEKLKATRALHERAHIYLPTTLTLMRRGSALSSRSTPPSRVTSPPRRSKFSRDGATMTAMTSPAQPLMGQASTGMQPRPEGLQWDHWIAQEETRRAAFAAFIIDATHTTMFGHSPTLVIHEINLSLPCDNALWVSEYPHEIWCVESSLHANGITRLSFLDGLRRTLSGQAVYTSPFGRIAILAGLLSVIWQMNQRETYRSSLPAQPFIAGQEKWRPKLLRALDWWKKNYEDSEARAKGPAFDWQQPTMSGRLDGHSSFLALGDLLYHLGHITMHITMPELCAFAGADQILGRAVVASDLRKVEAKMKSWPTSLRAINAVYHSLKLITLILTGPRDMGLQFSSPEPTFPYSASTDKIPSRAWALYIATLLVWAYGYTVDGPLYPLPPHLSYPPDPVNSTLGDQGGLISKPSTEDLQQDLKQYLETMLPPSVRCVESFHVQQNTTSVVGSRNRVLGLMALVDQALSDCEWELLGEARERLRKAALMIAPRQGSVATHSQVAFHNDDGRPRTKDT
ncbi:fungal-specific transcription factor domain-containing protein [Aspergillus heterothallicus]